MKKIFKNIEHPFQLLFTLAGLLLIVGITIFAGVTYASNHSEATSGSGEHLLTIYDRGSKKVVLTNAETIGEALKEANIVIDEKDSIEPGLDTKITSTEYNVNIYHARPVVVVDGKVRQKVMTAYQTAEQIAEDVGITLYHEDKTEITLANDAIDGAALQLTITRATPFEFTLYGKSMTARTQAKTVGEMLTEKGIELSENDRVTPDKDTPITEGLIVKVWREGKQTITVDEEVPFETEKIEDANQPVGYSLVKTAGIKGTRNVTYEIIMADGQEVSRTEIASLVTKQPQKEVKIVGTQNNFSSSLNEWLLALRTCESGGNYNRNSGNGYYGAYQFLPSTWNRIAARIGRSDLVGVRPDLAAPADQDVIVVANAQASSGGLATQHPGCYKKLGLSAKPPE